jgi:hypothetical protein
MISYTEYVFSVVILGTTAFSTVLAYIQKLCNKKNGKYDLSVTPG